MRTSPIVPLLLGLAATVAHSQQTARLVKYHANDIVSVHAKMRYTTLIELPATEKIMEVATGDKDFWIIDTDTQHNRAEPTAQRRTTMSKLKIEKGASKVRRAPLKVTIDGTVADDLELMCQWSENESSYLVNLLLGFAIAHSEEFQKYKAEQTAETPPIRKDAKPALETARKIVPSASSASAVPDRGATA